MKWIHSAVVLVCLLSSVAFGEPGERTFTFVYIITGPATDVEPAVQQEAFAGHFSNMARMAEDGDLLVAGPFWKPMSSDDLRGMWIFSTDEIDQALEHAATDPPGKLGIFVFDAVQIVTDDALLELPRLEKEDEERRLADPDIPDEWAGRGYFWATAAVGQTSEPERVEGVSLLARMIGREGSRVEEDRWLVLVDATKLEDALHVIRKAGCNPEDWMFDEWYGSAMPAQLPSLRD